MNPFEFLLLLLGMVVIFQMIKKRGGLNGLGDRTGLSRDDRRGIIHTPSFDDTGETRMLRDEVKALKERIQVLERITVEKENSLAREIEDLRRK